MAASVRCVRLKQHAHTLTERVRKRKIELALLLHCLWVLLPLPFSIYCFLLLFSCCCSRVFVVLVVGMFYKRVSACFTHVSGLARPFVVVVLAVLAPSAKSYFLIICRERVRDGGGSQPPSRHFLWLANTLNKKKEARRKTRIGIINSLLHLLLSGANCVFVYIILCWPNALKVLMPAALKALPCPLLNVHFKLPLLSFLWPNCGFLQRVGGGDALGRVQFMERVEPRTVVNGTWTHRRPDKVYYYVARAEERRGAARG